MRSHLRGGLKAVVFGFVGLGGLGLGACTFTPRYPVEAGVAPGDGAQPILPRYPVHEAEAQAASAPPPRAAPPVAAEPAYGPPLPQRAPVQSADLPPPPASAAYVEGESEPVLIEAAVRHRKPEPALRGPERDEEAPPPRHGRHGRKAQEARTATVQPGENLYRISLRTHVPVEALAKLNHIKPPYALQPGRVLDLPSSGGEAAAADEAPGDAAVRSRRGPGFREETAAELRAEKAEQRRLEREGASTSSRGRKGRGAEPDETVASGRKAATPRPATAPSPEDLLPAPAVAARTAPPPAPSPAPASVTATARAPEPSASLPTGGPRPYSEVFGAPAAPSRRGRGGRTHEDAAAAVAAAAVRHPSLSGETADLGSAAAAVSGRGRFVWPVRGEVISGFGPLPSGGRNDGVDLAAGAGDPVHAAAAGEVVYAGGAIPGFGNLVLIKHVGGFVTAYGHLSRIDVAMRQTVAQGEVVGEAGATGAVARPELHFEIRYSPSPDQSAKPVDPAPLLPPHG